MQKETRKTANKKITNKTSIKILKFVNNIILENLSQGEALAKAEGKHQIYLDDMKKRATFQVAASKLIKTPEAQEYIKLLQDEEQNKAVLDIRNRKQILSDIARSKFSRDGDRIKAIDTLNKMDLYNTPQEEVEEEIIVELED